VVSNSGDNGIVVIGGTAESREFGTGETRDNQITGTIVRNTVQGSVQDGIAVFGGFDNSSGTVIGNRAVQDIINNTADGIRCQDGIAGNTATCTQSGNIITASVETTPVSRVGEGQHSQASPAVVQDTPALRLAVHSRPLAAKTEQLRQRAQMMQDNRMRTKLLGFADRLDAIQGEKE